VKVDDQVKTASTDITHYPKDLRDRTKLWTVSQLNAVYSDDLVRNGGEFDYLAGGLAGHYGKSSVCKPGAERGQCRQTEHHVAQLAKVDYENILKLVLGLQ
jgi:hypothetical protein